MCDKEISAVLPPESEDTEYLQYAGSDAIKYPVYDKDAAMHNEKAIPGFLRQLENIVGADRIKECDGNQSPNMEILTG